MDIRKLSVAQLAQLANKIQKRQDAMKSGQADDARKEINAVLKKFGLELADVFPAGAKVRAKKAAKASAAPAGEKAAGKAKVKVGGRRRRRNTWIKKGMKAKYANPADAKQTWVGIGKRPFWFVDAIKGGATAESMLIK